MTSIRREKATMLPTAAMLFEKLPRMLRRHRLMMAWMKFTREDPVQLVRIRDDLFGYADMSDGFLRLIVIEGDFEWEFFALADAFLAEGGVFLDVGANYGLLSFGLAGRHGNKVQFHLFEPNPKLLASIQRSVARYPAMQCTVNRVAVSDRVGVVSFLIDHQQSGVSHLTDKDGEQVPSVTIDSYLEEAKVDRVALMKMDIEGYELAGMRGASRSLESRRIQAVYFEYSEAILVRVASPQDLIEYLQAMEYEVCFCRKCDILPRGSASHTISSNLPGHGIALLPVAEYKLPAMTDLIAIPKENLVSKF
jgi:FkbM family methyltransferase